MSPLIDRSRTPATLGLPTPLRSNIVAGIEQLPVELGH
jgi:hypothetical protein